MAGMRRHHARRKRRTRKQALAHGKHAKALHARLGGRTGGSVPRRARQAAAPRVTRPEPSPTELGFHDVNRVFTIAHGSTGLDCAVE